MAEGFQTQLSETFNKRRQDTAPLLEAFLDASGRMAFRYVGEGGEPIAQPRVTTPGFVPSSLGTAQTGATGVGFGASGTSITPQASSVAPGILKESREGGFGTTPDDAFSEPSLQTAPATNMQLALAGFLTPGPSMFTALAQKAGLRGVVGGPAKPSFTTPEQKEIFDQVVALGRQGLSGFGIDPGFAGEIADIATATGGAGPGAGPGSEFASSMNDLDNMSSIGTEGGGGFGAGAGATASQGQEPGEGGGDAGSGGSSGGGMGGEPGEGGAGSVGG